MKRNSRPPQKPHDPACVGPDYADDMAAIIIKHGHATVGVMSDGTKPSFAYTVGLYPRLGAELIIIGLPNAMAGGMFNHIARECQNENDLPLDTPDHRWANLPMVFKRCDASQYAFAAFKWHAALNALPCFLQIIIPDRAGRFPWDRAYDHDHMDRIQPLLYRMDA